MKSIFHLSFSERISSKSFNILLNPSLNNRKSKLSTKTEFEKILFNRKTSLEVLSNLIKSFLDDFLSKQVKAIKIKQLKQIVYTLKNNLSFMLIEKREQFDYLTKKDENNKKRIQNILFSDTQIKKVNNIQIKDNLNFSNIKKGKELKLINFQIENEIQKTQFLIERKIQNNIYAKSLPIFLNRDQEVFCNINYENFENISDILKTMKNLIKEEFVSEIKEKMKTESKMNTISLKINSIKENILKEKFNINKKYINPEEVIYEDSKENNNTIIMNHSKRNSNVSQNKSFTNKKIFNVFSKNEIKKNLTIDSIMKDNAFRKKIFVLNSKNGKKFNENRNKIKNYLNMNINVNINLNNKDFNKFNYSTSSLEEDEYLSDDKDGKFEIKLDDNNKIIVSPIKPKEDINSITNKNSSNIKNKRNNYKFQMNNKEFSKLNSKSSDNLCSTSTIKYDF